MSQQTITGVGTIPHFVVEDLIPAIQVRAIELGNKTLGQFLSLQNYQKSLRDSDNLIVEQDGVGYFPYFLSRIFESENEVVLDSSIVCNAYQTIQLLMESDDLLTLGVCCAFNLTKKAANPNLHRRINTMAIYLKDLPCASLEEVNAKLEKLGVRARAYPPGELPTYNFEDEI